ncbi:MAG: non-canonical purine NTP pyrophosphatase [Patescibacteria group bacterium]
MKILIGTTNPGKFKEIHEVLGDEHELVMPQEVGIHEVPEETGGTYEENAIIKANFYHEKSGQMTTIAEDSGIELEAFPGELGYLTRRWGKGENATDEEWLAHFLEIIRKTENKNAVFRCTTAVIHKGKTTIFIGECHGKILSEPQTAIPKGIPISSCFLPNGFEKVYAALTPTEKNTISHRGRAMMQVRDFLTTL